jgi:hypothetical protein
MHKSSPIVAFTSRILCAAMILTCALIHAQTSSARTVPVPPPPMGWSSWNSFSNTVDSQIIMEQAKAMVASGMQKAGYQYINIDEGWWLGKRNSDGAFVIDEKSWPALKEGERAGDMANIVRFIHGLGLKAGIYTDAGSNGCSMFPDLGPVYMNVGSEGHYEQDFLQFARWGFDYVKVDWCGGNKENLDPAVQYAEIARAIARAEKLTGHSVYYSICNWGKDSPWTWAPHVGGVAADIWRTSGDIVDPIVASGKNSGRKAGFDKMLGNFDQGIHPEAQHTGFYNDPDMMVLGMPGFSDAQNRAHMSLWAMSGAPLLVGADLAKLSPETLATLTNPAVLAIDQDALGLQAVKVSEPEKGLQVWAKPLSAAGTRAVLLLNRTTTPSNFTVSLKDVGLGDSAIAQDLWSGKDLGAVQGSYASQVPPSEAVLLLVKGKDLPSNTYRPESVFGTDKGRPCKGCELTFSHVASHFPWAQIRIVYTNPDKEARFAELRVNGLIATRIAFPPTGSKSGEVSVMSLLTEPNAGNVLRFAADHSSAEVNDPPAIQSIAVQ